MTTPEARAFLARQKAEPATESPDVAVHTHRAEDAHERAGDAPHHQRYAYAQSVRITARQKTIALKWARGEKGACSDENMRALIRYLLGDT